MEDTKPKLPYHCCITVLRGISIIKYKIIYLKILKHKKYQSHTVLLKMVKQCLSALFFILFIFFNHINGLIQTTECTLNPVVDVILIPQFNNTFQYWLVKFCVNNYRSMKQSCTNYLKKIQLFMHLSNERIPKQTSSYMFVSKKL